MPPLAAGLAALWLCCTLAPLQLTGGGSDTEISGKIVSSDARPAANTEVTLLPCNFNPAAGPAHLAIKDTTDAAGAYSLTVRPPFAGQYTLQAVQLAQRTRALVTGITVVENSDTTRVPHAFLRVPGAIKCVLPDSVNPANGYVYVPGTMLFARLANGGAFIDSVPAGYVPAVYYGSSADTSIMRVLRTGIVVPSGDTAAFADYRSWKYSRQLFLNTTASGAGVAGTVPDFPVLVRLDSTNFDFSQAAAGGADLRFTKSDDAPLPFEIELWDSNAKSAAVWVRLDTVYGNSSSRFFLMYWGASAASASGSAAVFGDYAGVWHLGEEAAGVGTRGLYRDATGKNNGDDSISSTDQSGIAGKGHGFDGVDDYIVAQSSPGLCLKNQVSTELWVYPEKYPDTESARMLVKRRTYSVELRTDKKVTASVSFFDRDVWLTADDTLPLNAWTHIVATYDGSTFSLYLNGVRVASKSASDTLWANSNNLGFAFDPVGPPFIPDHFGGKIDEVRIAGNAHSADRIKLSYMNQKMPDALIRQK
jgi:hypothetical protein